MDRRIVDTILEMVREGSSLSSLSLVTIARAAGVSRNSIYRRWRTKERLFIDVVKSVGRTAPALSEHSARENLVLVLDFYFGAAVDPRVFRLEDAVHAEARNFPDVFDSFNDVVVAPLSSALRSAIRAGKATREIRIDVDEDDLVAALVASSRARAGSASLSLVNLIFDGATSG